MYGSLLYSSRVALRASRSLIVPFRASYYSPKTSFGQKTHFRWLATATTFDVSAAGNVSTTSNELKKYNDMWKDFQSRHRLSGEKYLSVECIYSMAMLAVSIKTLHSGVGFALGSNLGIYMGAEALIMCFLDWSGNLKKIGERLSAKYSPKENCDEIFNDKLELEKETVEIMTDSASAHSYLAKVYIGSGLGAMILESFSGGQNIVSTAVYMFNGILMTAMVIIEMSKYVSLYLTYIKYRKT